MKALVKKWHSGQFRTRKDALEDLIDEYPQLKKLYGPGNRYASFYNLQCTWNGWMRLLDPTCHQGFRNVRSDESDEPTLLDLINRDDHEDIPDDLDNVIALIRSAQNAPDDQDDDDTEETIITDDEVANFRAELETITDQQPESIDDDWVDIQPEEDDELRAILEQRDRRRIESTRFRAATRIENAYKAYWRAMLACINRMEPKIHSWEPRTDPPAIGSTELVAHLTDTHFNELVDLPNNKYDFRVASRRLQKYACMIKLQALVHNAQKVHLAIGGDLINSDRRTDEYMEQASDRGAACGISSDLMMQFISDLRQDLFIECYCVPGNEGRATKELGFAKSTAMYSFDVMVYRFAKDLLNLVFPADPGLKFHDPEPNEKLFDVLNKKFLLMHGHTVKATDQKAVQAIIGKYSQAGVKVDHILCGHIHNTFLGDMCSRSASLCGGNAYSDQGLNFASRAAQNLHIVTNDSAHGVKVDLQDYSIWEGYEIQNKLMEYGARSINGTDYTP